MLVARRARELALLRAVGATRGQIRRSVLAEAALVGVTGSAAGFAAGIALAYLAIGYAASFDPTLAGTVTVGPLVPAATLAVGTMVTMLAAWLPARRAGQVPPAMGLRTALVEATRKPRWRRRFGMFTAIPTALLLAGGIAGNGPFGLLGALLLLITVLLLVPAISDIAALPLNRRLRHGGTLALAVQNVQRNPHRTAATASAILLGVALTTGIAVFAATITTQTLNDMGGPLAGDIVIHNVAGGQISPDIRQTLHRLPGVATTALRSATIEVDGQPTRASAIDPAALGTTVHLNLAGANPADLGYGAFVARRLADQRGWRTGQQITLHSPRGASHPATIAAILPGTSPLGDVVLPPHIADRHFPPGTGNPLLVAVSPGTSPEDLTRRLNAAVADRPDLQVSDPETYIRSQITEIDAFLGVSGGLLGLSLLIAFLGVINTLALSVTERTSEIGMLRAIGMTRRQIHVMVHTESMLMATLGGLLGLACGNVIGAMWQHLVLARPVHARRHHPLADRDAESARTRRRRRPRRGLARPPRRPHQRPRRHHR
jgi:putative ABC transport system permease protein